MSEKVRTLPKFKAGDRAKLLEETIYLKGEPVNGDMAEPRVVDIVVVRERVDLKTQWGYRVEGHPGIHEERYLEACSEENLRVFSATVQKKIDLKEMLAETYRFAMNEIVQVADIDEADGEEPLAYRYAIVTGIGFDEQGKTYYLGMWDGESSFLDTQYEMVEEELMKVTEENRRWLLSAGTPRPHLTLASNNHNPIPA